jgi:surface polysaccharide O-acyltransferase-like enzyme
VVWCVVYAGYYMVSRGDSWMDFARNILHIPVNFGVEIGHMWFIYMLLGLYMLVPVLSPWLVQCSKRELQGYLGVWAFTTYLPYIHLWFPEVLGECFWNPSPMLHYFTGFVGYFVLGYYIKRYGALSLRTSLWMLIGAYLLTVAVYQYRLGKVTLVSDLEVCWRFCGVNIAIMAYAVFSLVSNIRWKGNRNLRALDKPSFQFELCHLFRSSDDDFLLARRIQRSLGTCLSSDPNSHVRSFPFFVFSHMGTFQITESQGLVGSLERNGYLCASEKC